MSDHSRNPRSVAVVSAIYPYPVDSGKRVVVTGLLRYWQERVGVENVHYVLVGRRPDLPDEGDDSVVARCTVHVVDPPSGRQRMGNLVTRTVMRRHSLQESMVWGAQTAAELRGVLKAINADIEIFDTLRLSQYIDSLAPHPARFVYLEDLFSRRYVEMARQEKKFPGSVENPLGEFGTNVPAVGRVLIGNRHVLNLVLQAEAKLIARQENLTVRGFPGLLVNGLEVNTLNERAGVSAARTLTPLLPRPAVTPRNPADPPEIIFLGLLSLPHNEFAIRDFLEKHFAACLEAVPGLRLRIIGRKAPQRLIDQAARFPQNVTLEGFVDDLGEVMSRASAMIAPLQFGTGIKLKMIEALARALPVLATSYGAEGIAETQGQGCIIEDDLSRYPEHLRTLIDPQANARFSQEALAHYEARFAPEVVAARYDEVFRIQP